MTKGLGDTDGYERKEIKMYSKITYYHTLYKKDITCIVCGAVEFHYTDHAYVTFKSGGHGYLVDTQYIKKIEPIE